MIYISHYTPKDKKSLIQLIVELQKFLVGIDSFGRIALGKDFEKIYIKNLLKDIKKFGGTIFIAREKSDIIGCAACIILEQNTLDICQNKKSKTGKVIELIVTEAYRGKGIGTKLIKQCELFFKSKNCDFSLIEAFGENMGAYHLYKKLGYRDRLFTLGKKI